MRKYGGFLERLYGLSLKVILSLLCSSLAKISYKPTFTCKGIRKMWPNCAPEEKEMNGVWGTYNIVSATDTL